MLDKMSVVIPCINLKTKLTNKDSAGSNPSLYLQVNNVLSIEATNFMIKTMVIYSGNVAKCTDTYLLHIKVITS